MKRYSVLLVLVLLSVPLAALAQSLDDQYLQIFGLIQEGDSLSSAEPAKALAKYNQAQNGLLRLQKENPSWNASVVNFRMGYVAQRIKALADKVPAAVAPASGGTNQAGARGPPAVAVVPAAAAAPSDWEEQLNGLKEQVRQLQADKGLLEAKVKEAFAAQPAQVDPRELAQAEDKIKALQKENELLKVTMDQQKAKPAPAADTKALEQAQQALAESNRQLAAQKETIAQMTLQNQALEGRVKSSTADAAAAAAVIAENQSLKKQLADVKTVQVSSAKADDTARQLAEANRQLAAQTETTAKLTAEKGALEGQIKTLTADSQNTAALRSENQTLKKQLADSKAAPAAAPKSEETARQLALLQTQVTSLQSNQMAWELEKTAMENRMKKLSGATVTNRVLPAASSPADQARIRDLETERDGLEKKLDAANKELYGRKGKAVAGRVEELQNQLAAMRARLEVLEARQVPYSAEELALLKKPAPKLNEPAPMTEKKPANALPAGSAKQVAEAEGYFASKQYDKAEAIYLQILSQDSKNVPVLANLAAIQLEERHFDAAETNLRQALSVNPEDAYSLYVLGSLKFRQARYDEALDALSRAAKIDPRSPEIQNYIGLTLFEKGMRGPAETALRKAVELRPDYGAAHQNLAVFYITQDPPYAALARWHYQKALDSGHPHNPTLEKMLENAK